MNNQDNTTFETEGLTQGKGLIQKDFILLVIGQIISLFGNGILRFALPLYILDKSGSAALFGIVSAFAFLPMVIMSPIGGIVADRVNKQRIMVVVDFITSAIILCFILLNGRIAIAPLIIVVLMLLYSIQGAYAPAVQASLPLLIHREKLVPANAVVNLVQSFSGLMGPVIGGLLYGTYGLSPILIASCICFTFAAVMELFLRIPHKPRKAEGGVWVIVRDDMAQSFHFIFKENPVLGKVLVLVFAFNLILSALLIIGLPVIITQTLGMSSQLYGFSQGALAAGGLLGGILAGILGKKLDIRQAYIYLLICSIGLVPMGLTLLFGVPAFISYLIITAVSFFLMAAATLFTIQMMAFVQAETPVEIVGKVIACLMAISICAQPIGQTLYGILFEYLPTTPWVILLSAALISGLIVVYSKNTFNKL